MMLVENIIRLYIQQRCGALFRMTWYCGKYTGFCICYLFCVQIVEFLDECRYEFWGSYWLKKLNIWRKHSLEESMSTALLNAVMSVWHWYLYIWIFPQIPNAANADSMIFTTLLRDYVLLSCPSTYICEII